MRGFTEDSRCILPHERDRLTIPRTSTKPMLNQSLVLKQSLCVAFPTFHRLICWLSLGHVTSSPQNPQAAGNSTCDPSILAPGGQYRVTAMANALAGAQWQSAILPTSEPLGTQTAIMKVGSKELLRGSVLCCLKHIKAPAVGGWGCLHNGKEPSHLLWLSLLPPSMAQMSDRP